MTETDGVLTVRVLNPRLEEGVRGTQFLMTPLSGTVLVADHRTTMVDTGEIRRAAPGARMVVSRNVVVADVDGSEPIKIARETKKLLITAGGETYAANEAKMINFIRNGRIMGMAEVSIGSTWHRLMLGRIEKGGRGVVFTDYDFGFNPMKDDELWYDVLMVHGSEMGGGRTF